jgi:GNAT superfamily N-acetyltransferase
MSQATGLAMERPIDDADLEALESFYFGKGSPARIVVCPHADPSLFAAVNHRGYRLSEFENVMVRQLTSDDAKPRAGSIELQVVTAANMERFINAVGPNFSEDGILSAEMREMMSALSGLTCLRAVLGRVDNCDAGGGSLMIHEGLAMLAGAGTLPAFRNRGVHTAVFQERIRLAAENGCDLAVMGSTPGSGSQRNAERKGFHVAYTKAVMMKEPTTTVVG